jgi:hypothetical protein
MRLSQQVVTRWGGFGWSATRIPSLYYYRHANGYAGYTQFKHYAVVQGKRKASRNRECGRDKQLNIEIQLVHAAYFRKAFRNSTS